MQKYLIHSLVVDGYERYVEIENCKKKNFITVHLLECDEYLEDGENSKMKYKGKCIEGNLSIDLVTTSRKTEGELSYFQNIEKSSHIEAVVRVEKIIDEFSIFASSNICNDLVKIEFERKVNYKKGDIVWISGSLELIEGDL